MKPLKEKKQFAISGLVVAAMLICMTATANATTISFTPDQNNAGCWSYDGDGKFTFGQNITVDRGLGKNDDTLVGAFVHLPDLILGGIPGAYTLSGGTISITDSPTLGAENVTYMTGTLDTGSLITVGSIGAAYAIFDEFDITGITIDNTIGSDALDAVGDKLDFQLGLTGGTGGDFANMLADNLAGSDSFTGSMTVPEPATVALLGIGMMIIRRKRLS